MLGNGNGTFTALPPQDAGGGPWQVALGDVDGDGDIDVAAANSFSANGGLYRQRRRHARPADRRSPMDGHTPASDLGDLDGDGDLDWCCRASAPGIWRIFVNDGAGNFTLRPGHPGTVESVVRGPRRLRQRRRHRPGAQRRDRRRRGADAERERSEPALSAGARDLPRAGPGRRRRLLILKDKTPDKGDQLLWKWVKGPTTPLADFGDPLTADDLALCLYDAGALVTSATADAGGTCGTKPCWTAKPTTLAYKNRDTSSTGTQVVKLKEGLVDGKASIVWKAKGLRVAMPALDMLGGPLTVQMHRSGGGPCFGATYSAPFLQADGSTILKDKAD